MKYTLLYTALFALFTISECAAQTTSNSILTDSNITIKGIILDYSDSSPLAYANIAIQNSSKGSISNEKGHFSLDITGLNDNDSLSFQYIGFQTQTISIADLQLTSTIYLKEDIQNLKQVYVFGNPLKAKDIIKMVIKNKDQNYSKQPLKSQTFIRNKDISDIEHFELKYKKSSFDVIDEKLIASIPSRVPKHSTSYTDFLGYTYYSKDANDSNHFKIEPIKTVSLKDKDLADLDQLESAFESIFINPKEKEYWKAKTGIFSTKIEVNLPDSNAQKKGAKTKDYQRMFSNKLRYSSLKSESDWEFLYSLSRYNYTLLGGTQVNDEDVYIIEFTPKNKGSFQGRVYISIKTYALIRADYEYAPGKMGTDGHLLGIGYTENYFSGSILFEKKNDNYRLKYCSKKTGVKVSIDRKISLLKKRERFLLDKTLKEVKVGLEITVAAVESFEILVLNNTDITNQQFNTFQQKEYMKIVYVDQFNDQLWKGYSIIEPTQQMREYKKME